MYKFLTYCESTEEMMRAWYKHSASTLEHSSDLGFVREHFVKQILANFLPKTVIVGSGEIIDGTPNGYSGQQDVILYRADFPVITSHTSINTYLIEGVIATIEVKSDLSKIGLSSPFESASRVKRLTNEAIPILNQIKFENEVEHESPKIKKEFEELKKIHTVKTFVVGYKGWKTAEGLVKNYRIARTATNGLVPDVVYYPGYSGNAGYCVINDSYFFRTNIGGVPNPNKSYFTSEAPFAAFFQLLLKAIMQTISVVARSPGFNVELQYTLNRYLSLPKIIPEDIDDKKYDPT